MKILNVNNMLDPVTGGGTAERTYHMSRALVKAGHAVTILTTDAGLTSERVSELDQIGIVAFRCISRRFFIPLFTFRKVRELVQQADIIHLMGHWSVLNAAVYLAAVRMNKPYVVCPAGALPIFGRSKLLKKIYNGFIGHRLVRNATACIAVTTAEIPHFHSYGVPRGKIHVIPNGVAQDDIPPSDPLIFRQKHTLGNVPCILFVGRLDYIKGPDLLLQAFCNVKNVLPAHHLVFVGPDGGMLESLKATVRQHNVTDRVHFPGYIGGVEKFQAYAAADLLVIPSRQEAMSIVALEAGITGTPVLLTDQCGFPEVAQCHGGQVVGVSVPELEKGLLDMLSKPAGTLKLMGASLKAYIEQKYSWSNLVHVYTALYSQCSVASSSTHKPTVPRYIYPAAFMANKFDMTGLRVLIVTQYFWPEVFRINDLAQALKERGHAVTVLTGMPNYPGGRFFNGYRIFSPAQELYEGIPIRRVPIIPRFSARGWQLVLNYLSFVVSASILGPLYCRGRFDLIFVYEPSPITVGLPALLLKKLKRAPMLFWVQDLWPETLTATGMIHTRWILNIVERMVRLIYRGCDRVLVQSRAFVEPVAKLGVDRRRICYFPNSAEALYQPIMASRESGKLALLPSGFRVMFAGNIGAAQSFETILAAAEHLKDQRDLHWVILGEGRMFGWVQSEVSARGLENTVHLVGRQPMETMPEYFALADVMLVTLKDDPIFAMTIPAKLQSYLACGRPVVAAIGGEGARVVEEAGAGLTAPSDNPRALANAVLQMYQMTKEEREVMGARGRKYFEENFERKMLLERLDGWMREVMGAEGQCAS